MTRPTKAWKAIALAGVASLALAACGGSSDEATDNVDDALPKGDGTLKIGTLLPQTGSLAFLGPPEFAGVDLAIQEINAAGGVNGKDVEKSDGDSGDASTNIASQTADRLLSEGVDAIVGAASSSVTLTVIDKITSAGVVQFSPANTSIKLSTYPDNDLYFRTAPPDTFQGAVLGNLVAEDGNATAAVLALQDAYGEGLAKTFEDAFTGAGGSVTSTVIYDPKAADYSADVAKIAATKPDAIALIGFDESAKIVAELIKQGIGPQAKKLYLVDGNLSNSLFKDLPAGTMNGTKGTTPGAAAPEDFRASLLKINPALTDFSYSAESYDAVNLIALAAQAAGKDSGEAIGASLIDVSEKGEKCSNFADCKKLLDDGKDIDYEGVSGPADLASNGDPKKATMGIYQYGADNKFSSTAIKYVTGDVPAAS